MRDYVRRGGFFPLRMTRSYVNEAKGDIFNTHSFGIIYKALGQVSMHVPGLCKYVCVSFPNPYNDWIAFSKPSKQKGPEWRVNALEEK